MFKITARITVAIVVLLCVSMTSVYAYKKSSGISPQIFVTLKVNDVIVKTDVDPYIKDGRVFVPIRFIAEILGSQVHYDPEAKRAIIVGNGKTVVLHVDDNNMSVNGSLEFIDAPAEITNGRTMVPLRALSESLNIDVIWDPITLSVLLNKEGLKVPNEYIYDRHYNDEDLLWLSRIVTIETGWQAFDAKLGVANVVLNRVAAARFPNTVYDVIYDTNYTVQFPPAFYSHFSDLVPLIESVIAAKMAFEGINNVDTCLFFNYVPFRSKRPDELYAIYDGEYFYR